MMILSLNSLYVEYRPLPGVGHFVSLEASDKLAVEIRRLLNTNTE
jgi:hypothetical protein